MITIRIILNGKKADRADVRAAVSTLRSEAINVEVRVTWERGDAACFAIEASREGVARIIAAGGDGTINEVVNALLSLERNRRPVLAIMPIGTANDFASACNIPKDPMEALRLATHGSPQAVDIGKANDRYFLNAATGGFVTQVTAQVPQGLKNLLGGSAYALAAIVKSLSFEPSQGRLMAEGTELKGSAVAGAVCNCRQAGGGQMLAPEAYINDGLLDVMIILTFPISDVGQVIQEILNPSYESQYVRRFRSKWIESRPHRTRVVNLDGEPYEADHILFEVMPKELNLVLPEDCPCILN